MGKFVLESALFLCILWQVYALATGSNKFNAPSLQNKSYEIAEKGHISYIPSELYATNAASPSREKTLNPYRAGPYAANAEDMKIAAQQEAQRILATGDYQSLQKRIEDNSFLLKLSGF